MSDLPETQDQVRRDQSEMPEMRGIQTRLHLASRRFGRRTVRFNLVTEACEDTQFDR
jgi:hypothetical protein